ncbi:Hsp20/alpha crystallin family protein [Blastopirellula sp. JC732]|uniref:Hsp20/alpha crystallin family protein n=1 Tax=Blastopirellula sediminis TaxID=2894196 RepID=A0A9X1MN16_9BACT|nr:Hsp20/alpha crystallin family protein [Blastopirellula sediminis]MCC9608326.1 Hsp20/alpha crystallin family protein [Blastopirellula sediminis]MCC9628897.1 Hsp20/alpha crystallin family protein [Blastopirellula sediminis]
MFQRFWDERNDVWGGQVMSPALDLKESDTDVTVSMDLPGVDAKEVDIQINGNQLVISGERKEEKEEKGQTFHRIERRSGRFSRTTTLPCAVEEDKIDARMKDGILTVMLPKSPEAQSRHIEVKTT